MKLFFRTVIITFLLFAISCKEKEKPATQANIAMESKRFNDWLDAQFEEDLAESPQRLTALGRKTDYGKWDDISSEKMAQDHERNKERLDKLNGDFDPVKLDSTAALSYELYQYNLKHDIADYEWRFYNYPLNQMYGLHTTVPTFLANQHRVDSLPDAEAYIERIKRVKPLFAELHNQLWLREKNDIVPPKFVIDRVLEDCRNLLKGRPFEKSNGTTPILTDFEEKINALKIGTDQKEKLVVKAEHALLDSLLPAYTDIIDFLEGQQQRATTEVGAWKFPHGEDFYAHALENTTTTPMSAAEIHKLGLDEVARIHREMKDLMGQVGFKGTLQDFFKFMRDDDQFYYPDTEAGRADYLASAKAIIEGMRGKLNEMFLEQPTAKLTVKAVEPFRARSAGKAFYNIPAPDGSRPGIYYVNLYDMKAMPKYQMEALAYHEGIPGHHMQLALAQELDSLPKFRKYGGYTSYIEGWGLYSEYMPKEMGFYTDPYSDFGRLALELWRACRLVVDTGIHNKKWTREEAIDYYLENTPNAESDCIKMVERHIVMPGQAAAYKIGMNKILQLREKAKKELGDDFDLKEFHKVVLSHGAVPLSVLEKLVDRWINKN